MRERVHAQSDLSELRESKISSMKRLRLLYYHQAYRVENRKTVFHTRSMHNVLTEQVCYIGSCRNKFQAKQIRQIVFRLFSNVRP